MITQAQRLRDSVALDAQESQRSQDALRARAEAAETSCQNMREVLEEETSVGQDLRQKLSAAYQEVDICYHFASDISIRPVHTMYWETTHVFWRVH